MTSAMVAMDLVFTGASERRWEQEFSLHHWYAHHPSG